mmetsp:Transcript_29635/g.74532  ORF Transcript_29635/g.74532 Transcript_29635/m.74532 type:complete len:201 (-) Transcript_29635:914-1516(-)
MSIISLTATAQISFVVTSSLEGISHPCSVCKKSAQTPPCACTMCKTLVWITLPLSRCGMTSGLLLSLTSRPLGMMMSFSASGASTSPTVRQASNRVSFTTIRSFGRNLPSLSLAPWWLLAVTRLPRPTRHRRVSLVECLWCGALYLGLLLASTLSTCGLRLSLLCSSSSSATSPSPFLLSSSPRPLLALIWRLALCGTRL